MKTTLNSSNVNVKGVPKLRHDFVFYQIILNKKNLYKAYYCQSNGQYKKNGYIPD